MNNSGGTLNNGDQDAGDDSFDSRKEEIEVPRDMQVPDTSEFEKKGREALERAFGFHARLLEAYVASNLDVRAYLLDDMCRYVSLEDGTDLDFIAAYETILSSFFDVTFMFLEESFEAYSEQTDLVADHNLLNTLRNDFLYYVGIPDKYSVLNQISLWRTQIISILLLCENKEVLKLMAEKMMITTTRDLSRYLHIQKELQTSFFEDHEESVVADPADSERNPMSETLFDMFTSPELRGVIENSASELSPEEAENLIQQVVTHGVSQSNLLAQNPEEEQKLSKLMEIRTARMKEQLELLPQDQRFPDTPNILFYNETFGRIAAKIETILLIIRNQEHTSQSE